MKTELQKLREQFRKDHLPEECKIFDKICKAISKDLDIIRKEYCECGLCKHCERLKEFQELLEVKE